jgi:mannose-1-phosphate guanylyltransferase
LQEKFCRSSQYRVVTEPESRGTAGAIALSVRFIEKLHKDRKAIDDPIIVVVP